MNNRIERFMDYKGLSPSGLADAIGVQRSNITHVLHGRNKPSFQFITKMLETFPEINAKWLLTGKGDMLAGEEKTKQTDLFSQIVPPVNIEPEKAVTPEKPGREEKESSNSVQPMPDILQTISTTDDNRKIESIVIFYTDQTFKQYMPVK
jgi:plasmid maintenance system antidote protein VapI